MGTRPSYAIDVTNRSLCSELSWEEWLRLIDKIGLDEAIDLQVRVYARDRMLDDGKKSVPKHRKNPKRSDRP